MLTSAADLNTSSNEIMCYKPVNIRINRKAYKAQGADLIKTDVPCGHCPECNSKAKDEIKFRTYYELVRTLKNGGFVLSQCLTYKPELRPHFSDHVPYIEKDSDLDFVCFNRQHLRNFLVYLRDELKKLGFNPVGKLKYFISAEYGTDPNHEHAPHYHTLFFSTDTNLSWKVLSATIDKCWKFGLTDSILFKDVSYFTNPLKPHLLCGDDWQRFTALEKMSNYITEYLTKDSYFSKVIKSRLYKAYPIIKEHCLVDENVKKLYSLLKRNAFEHCQRSNHYGDNFLEFNSIKEIYETGKVKMPSSNPACPIVTIPLPMYFQRKLFYNLRKSFDNSLVWELNDFGQQYVFDSYPRKQKMLYDRIMNVLQYGLPTQSQEDREVLKENFYGLLGSRSMFHFVDYILLYRGRTTFDGKLNTPQEQLIKIVENNDLSFVFFSEQYEGMLNHKKQYLPFTSNKFVSYINQNSCKDFEYYDLLWSLFSRTLAKYSDLRAEAEYNKLLTKKTLRKNEFKSKFTPK